MVVEVQEHWDRRGEKMMTKAVERTMERRHCTNYNQVDQELSITTDSNRGSTLQISNIHVVMRVPLNSVFSVPNTTR